MADESKITWYYILNHRSFCDEKACGANASQSKQYLTAHTVDRAHLATIFAIAVTPKVVLSGGGLSSLAVHDSTKPDFPLLQTIKGANPTGCHHICASRDGRVAASASFSGDLKVWSSDPTTGEWKLLTALQTSKNESGGLGDESSVSDANPSQSAADGRSSRNGVWAVALSETGERMAATTVDNRALVWVARNGAMMLEHTFDGFNESFGTCVAISGDDRLVATGHQNGSAYVFSTETGRLMYSLSSLARPLRAISFSPGGSLLATAGDANIIAIYDVKHGEHIGNLKGHAAWITSLDWNDSGEYLASAALDGRVKVWSIDRLECVATHSETDEALWAVRWLPKMGRSEFFVTGGASRSLTFYREATGI
ncbi:Meiotic recombination protein rec14 [Ceratocystis fimbriata CBS 114723]|uniref:Meiotic recombination protein rec14 n=1 Tax=Ceratocystis fimbriata CBS 114723 TaxID=1035309 RepID=A0A2C5X6Z8_9PEZI|nr:Meiotic recombination protein rec14 [Ceratocystis fimbriata CBS 114723]